MINDLFLSILVFFLYALWQIVAFPLIFKMFSEKLVDGAWAFGRLFIWLLISLAIWFLAHLQIGINTIFGVWLLFLALSFFSFKLFEDNKTAIKKFWKKQKIIIIIQEILFIFGFLFMIVVRSYNPDILDLEKFMDAGFIVAYTKSPTLPLEDMWLAGEKVNYYTFGHFMGAVALNYTNVEIARGYNLLLALLMGIILAQSASIAINLTGDLFPNKNKRLLIVFAGIMASFLVTFGGNTHASWYFFKNLSFEGFWYPDSTRFIDRTIHEFPSYSFVVSDLHAHLWNLPIVLFLIINIFIWLKSIIFDLKNQKEIIKKDFFNKSIIIGIIFGIMVGTSAWDLAIYGLMLIIIGILLLAIDFNKLPHLIISALLILFFTLLSSSPWWLNFVSISEGVRKAHEHSPLWQLLVLWAGHVGVSILALVLWLGLFFKLKQTDRLKKSSHLLMLVAMTLTAYLLIIIPEFIFVKDIYPDHPRANTMFKLTFQSLTLMSIVIACFLAYLSQFRILFAVLVKRTKVLRVSFFKKTVYLKRKFKLQICKENLLLLPVKIIVSIFVVAVLIYPYFAYRDYYGGFKYYRGLDGLQWLKDRHLGDYNAIIWMNKYLVDRPVVVEAVGESYTTFARVSTFTGFPTILGWRVHQWLWRGGFDIPAKRTEEVRQIYENPLSAQSQISLNQYRVDYIFVGDKEREAYQLIDEIGLQQLGKIVFKEENTYLIQIN